MEKKQNNILHRVLWAYHDWLISTQAKCDCEWSRCLKKIFNGHNKKEIRTLREFLYIQSNLPLEDRNPFDADLQFLVGVAYLCGWLPCKDNAEEAHRWFRRSADQDSPRGEMGIGYLHEKHFGKYHDENYMLTYYSLAANKGYVPAQLRLTSYQQQQLKQIYQTSKDNNEILRRVAISVQMLQSSLNTMWTELRQDNAKAAEKWKQLMDRDLQKAASPQWASDTYLAKEDAEAFMSVLFKGDWREPGRLCDASCDALVTAYVLMKMADKLALSNYSGIVITAVWALEHECRRRFRDAFEAYLASVNAPEEEKLSRMNLMKYDKDDRPEFTLGSVYYIAKAPDFEDFADATKFLSPVAERERGKLKCDNKGMLLSYSLPGTWKRNPKEGKSFSDLIRVLNDKYRVPSAHAKEIGKKQAEECCDLLGITETHKKQAELAAANKKMDNITGALKALLWLTAPLE